MKQSTDRLIDFPFYSTLYTTTGGGFEEEVDSRNGVGETVDRFINDFHSMQCCTGGVLKWVVMKYRLISTKQKEVRNNNTTSTTKFRHISIFTDTKGVFTRTTYEFRIRRGDVYGCCGTNGNLHVMSDRTCILSRESE